MLQDMERILDVRNRPPPPPAAELSGGEGQPGKEQEALAPLAAKGKPQGPLVDYYIKWKNKCASG